MTEPWEDELEALSVLVEPVRRAMYRFARGANHPVTREEVAEAVGSSVKLAAFHLDKLVQHGWLRGSYAQTSHPTVGGRPPKLYEPSDRCVEVSLPPRRYDLMGELLLGGRPVVDEARKSAREWGRAAGERFRRERRLRRMGAERTHAAAAELLRELGFQPRCMPDGEVVLANCPFASLADSSPETVCEANLALVQGLVAGLDGSGVEVVAARDGEGCCVKLRFSASRR